MQPRWDMVPPFRAAVQQQRNIYSRAAVADYRAETIASEKSKNRRRSSIELPQNGQPGYCRRGGRTQ